MTSGHLRKAIVDDQRMTRLRTMRGWYEGCGSWRLVQLSVSTRTDSFDSSPLPSPPSTYGVRSAECRIRRSEPLIDADWVKSGGAQRSARPTSGIGPKLALISGLRFLPLPIPERPCGPGEHSKRGEGCQQYCQA